MTKSDVSKEQRKRVLERDNHRCVLCWRKNHLHIHHHWDFSGKLSDDEYKPNHPYVRTKDYELVTLCSSCHGKIQICHKHSPIYQYVTDYLAKIKEQTLPEMLKT